MRSGARVSRSTTPSRAPTSPRTRRSRAGGGASPRRTSRARRTSHCSGNGERLQWRAMVARPFLLALLALVLAAPAADAAMADPWVPLYDASDGVRAARQSDGEILIRFSARAAK